MISRRPILFASLFQGALIPVALLLAWLLGIQPFEDWSLTGQAVLTGAFATLPMLVFFGLVSRSPFAWARELEARIREVIVPLFRGSGTPAIFWVALLAGVGEELLFRGVIQTALENQFGALPGLFLAALIFGLAHYVTRAYFVLATLMGLYLGWLYQWTGNLLVPVLVHFLYDWIALEWYVRRERRRGAGGLD